MRNASPVATLVLDDEAPATALRRGVAVDT